MPYNYQAARQAGLSDQQIEQYLNSQGRSLRTEGIQIAPQKKDLGFKLSSLLPLLGGIVGGVGGGAVGSVIPGAGTAIGAGAGGAGGSALGEWLRQKVEGEDDLGKVVEEGAWGALGGGLGKVAKTSARVLGKAATTTLPERLMGSVFREPMKASRAAAAGGKSLAKESLEAGTRGTTKGMYNAAKTQIDNTENTLQEILTTSTKTIPFNNVKKTVQPLLQKYKQSGNTSAYNSLNNRLKAIEAEVGANVPAARANQIKRDLYDEAQKAYGSEASAEMEGIKAIARGFKENLDDIPGVSQLNKDLSFYGRQRDSMLDKMTRDERNNVLGLSDAILGGASLTGGGLPAAAAVVGGKKLLGSAAGKTNIAQGLYKSGKLLGEAPPITGEILGQTAGQVGARAGQLLTSGSEASVEEGMPIEGQLIDEGMGGRARDGQMKLTPEAALLLMVKYPKQASLIKQMLEISQPQAGKQTEAQVARDETAYLVDSALQQLGTKNLNIGLGASQLEELKSVFNAGDPDTLAFNRTIAALQASIAKARAGTSFTPNEQKLLNQYTPKIGDSKQQVAVKLQSLKQLFNRSSGTQIVPNYPDPSQGYSQAF